MDGLECCEIKIGELEFTGRIDAEYYQKKFLQYQNMVLKKNSFPMKEVCHFLIGPFGSAYNTDNYVSTPEYRYVRGQDVKPFFLQETLPRYISKDDYFRLSKYALEEEDILISVVGTLGNACIIQKEELPAIFSCKSTVIRTYKIDSYFLITYLNSIYGRQLLLRKERGAIQKGLNLDDLKELDIPQFSESFQKLIRNIGMSALNSMKKSNIVYHSSQQMLLIEMKFDKVNISTNGITEKSLSKSFGSTGRLDAEYYQPKYDDLFAALSRLHTKPLGQIVSITKSIEPGSLYYGSEGVPFIRVSDVSIMGINTPSIKIPKTTIPSIENLYPRKDTILFSKDGSVGIAYKVEKDMTVVTSGALLHFCVKNTREVLPDYLTLVLNSNIVQLQAERDSSGAIIQHWKPTDIEKVVIPILPINVQQEISENVQESFSLRRQAENLIQTAIKAVEIAIESDEVAALKWIESSICTDFLSLNKEPCKCQ